jgi:ribonuclease HI
VAVLLAQAASHLARTSCPALIRYCLCQQHNRFPYCAFPLAYPFYQVTLITLFTDGSSRGNPGPGGYGTILRYGPHEKELSQGFRRTTNNRMELLAVIVGLEAVTRPDIPILVVSDSKYVVDAVEKKWVFGWAQKPDFGKKANEDLWRRFLRVYKERKVSFKWIKGHAGHAENERCDVLAVQSALGKGLLVDEGYEALG